MFDNADKLKQSSSTINTSLHFEHFSTFFLATFISEILF